MKFVKNKAETPAPDVPDTVPAAQIRAEMALYAAVALGVFLMLAVPMIQIFRAGGGLSLASILYCAWVWAPQIAFTIFCVAFLGMEGKGRWMYLAAFAVDLGAIMLLYGWVTTERRGEIIYMIGPLAHWTVAAIVAVLFMGWGNSMNPNREEDANLD